MVPHIRESAAAVVELRHELPSANEQGVPASGRRSPVPAAAAGGAFSNGDRHLPVGICITWGTGVRRGS